MTRELKLFLAISWGALALLILAAGALFIIKKERWVQKDLPVYGQVPAFEFTERNGEPFGLSDMLGKINVVDLIFTRCPSACPIMSAKMQMLYRKFADTDKLQFVSISVDPEYDSLEALQEYATRYGVNDRRWLFLRAPMQDVVRLSEQGFKLSGKLPSMHSTKFVLVDARGRIRGYYDSFDDRAIETLEAHIIEMVNKMP